ncbi:hypothetical protein EVJ58_g585 [Rhodofomes roseus]|uniref:non-specific serine/threonine protein kinase n=1 Tax=Rhodofomes roseus TaxID=34475 RepID=A0A4Y9Z5L0_9APHY|nr:hypothetical protein EVJ58_g585 [Rhodofomes roseus]
MPYPDEHPSMLRGGTLLHKGFYDLLSMIPTTPSRMFWRDEQEPIAGPRYEDTASQEAEAPRRPAEGPSFPVPTSPTSPTRNLRGRKISKDMVSKPVGFVHLVHASDAEQAEALLTRWGPEGQGKLGDPRWADPIKDRLRQLNQARAVNEVVNGLKPSQSSMIRQGAGDPPPLRVVNGISTTTSSTITTAARENVSLSPVVPSGLPSSISPIQTVGPGGNSTIRWTAGLPAHPEHEHEDVHASDPDKELPDVPQAPVRKPIVPSLATLEKAVSAKIYFENLYFPLLRHPPSREQRRLAMEKDMMNMQLNEAQKEYLRSRWRQNETDYLRERRQKVDVSAFVKLKTIGHGAFGVVSLVRERSTAQLFAMKQLRKTDMLRKGQEGHVRAERDLLKSASLVSSPGGADWIVRLYYSFQDRDHLYLVLEYMGGGDLLNLLIERDVFEEDFTRFYVAENFLFDPQGHIKLSDFGLATDLHWAHDTSYYEQQRLHLLHKHGIDLEDSFAPSDGTRTKRLDRKEVERLMGGGDGQGGIFTWRERNRRKLAYSVCGTNSYMSPEVIRGHGYTYSCDWWSLGVIMFECLYGFPPFVSNSRHVTRQKILNWKQSLRFPSRPRVSHEGAVFGHVDGAHLIKAHPWFRGIDWENIHRYPAPYRPELRHPEDTRHFDDDIPPEPLAPANGAAADATRDPLLRDKVHGQEILEVRKALAFAGFTHKSPRVISYPILTPGTFTPYPDDT